MNYSAAEIARIKGVKSSEIRELLGYADSEYVALRENISFFVREDRPTTPAPLGGGGGGVGGEREKMLG